MVGGGAVVVGVVSGETPAANLPEWAVVFIMIGRLFVAFEAVGKWGGDLVAWIVVAVGRERHAFAAVPLGERRGEVAL